MHICPAEIGAALIMMQQGTLIYWYLKMRVQGFSERLRARFSPSKTIT
jgi:hypothetical protein